MEQANAGKANHRHQSKRRYFWKSQHTGQIFKAGHEAHSTICHRPATDVRLNSALQQWLGVNNGAATGIHPVAALQYFQLNTACSLQERCRPPFTVQWPPGGTALLNIPAINPVADITALAGTIAVQLHIMAVACRVSDTTIQSVQEQTIAYDYTGTDYPSRQVAFALPVGNGNLLLIAVALQYRLQDIPESYCTKIEWLPAGVVGGGWGIKGFDFYRFFNYGMWWIVLTTIQNV